MQRQDTRAPAAQAPDELTREVVALATALVRRMWAHHQARVAEFDLSQPEAKALLNLEPDCCLSMRELSAVLNANPSNVTVAVGRLEARGLVSRQGAGLDGTKDGGQTRDGLFVRMLQERGGQRHPEARRRCLA